MQTNRKIIRGFVNGFALWGLVIFGSGCIAAAVVAGAGAGAGTYSYIKGELQATYPGSLQKVWPKTLAAVESLKLHVDTKQMDALGGTIQAKRADGTEVKIQLKPAGDQSTTVGVRVGIFGDKAQSERIHGAIRRELGIS